MDNLNYLSVVESARREINATGAKLLVRISGQSFFTGSEAFKKAVEVAQCVEGLKSCGVPEDRIRIKNISTQVASGLLSKSSSATYELEVCCDSMDLLGPAVATIASLKNSAVESMSWEYSDIEKVKREILQDAVRSANASATAIVSALNVSLAGLHRLKYGVSGLDNHPVLASYGYGKMKRASVLADCDEAAGGLSLSHTANVVVEVSADFLVK